MPLYVTRKSVCVPASEKNLRFLVGVIAQIPREHVLGQLARLHQAIEKGCHTLLRKLRVRHADKGIELAVKDRVVNYHAKRPVGHS